MDENVDQALNVLSHGLEANRACSELWMYYLELYGKRAGSEDLIEMCEESVNCAATQALWWKVRGLSALSVCLSARKK